MGTAGDCAAGETLIEGHGHGQDRVHVHARSHGHERETHHHPGGHTRDDGRGPAPAQAPGVSQARGAPCGSHDRFGRSGIPRKSVA
jgi:hypothetical protein